MGGSSDNHVTVGHLTFREVSSLSFFGIRHLSSPFFERVQTILCEKNVKFLTAAISTDCSVEQLLETFFYCFGTFVMFCNYVYYICV